MMEPAPNPCVSCPYRRDVPSGVWSVEDYEKLPLYDAETVDQPHELFQCHQNGADSNRKRLCAGWVACHGDQLLSLRLAVVCGRVPGEVMDYFTSVPVFASGAEAAEHGMREIERPGREARALIRKIGRQRPEVKNSPDPRAEAVHPREKGARTRRDHHFLHSES